MLSECLWWYLFVVFFSEFFVGDCLDYELGYLLVHFFELLFVGDVF